MSTERRGTIFDQAAYWLTLAGVVLRVDGDHLHARAAADATRFT
jgi:hypothetical protein